MRCSVEQSAGTTSHTPRSKPDFSDVRVLLIDDDPSVLRGLERNLRRKFNLVTTTSPRNALDLLKTHSPFDPDWGVVVTDQQMPEMMGIEFLMTLKQRGDFPVRMMLTGEADVQKAVQAVNEGNIFRFLIKPCDTGTIATALEAGIEQFRLERTERDLLQNTITEAVRSMVQILSLSNPISFGQSTRIHRMARKLAIALRHEVWEVETAALLSQLGCVSTPKLIHEKLYEQYNLTNKELKMLEEHPDVGANIIQKIPRFERVASHIRLQNKPFQPCKDQPLSGMERELKGHHFLKLALDWDTLTAIEKKPLKKTWDIILQRTKDGVYHPELIAVLKTFPEYTDGKGSAGVIKEIKCIEALNLSMTLIGDVLNTEGVLLISGGQQVTVPLLNKLKVISKKMEIQFPIKVEEHKARLLRS